MDPAKIALNYSQYWNIYDCSNDSNSQLSWTSLSWAICTSEYFFS